MSARACPKISVQRFRRWRVISRQSSLRNAELLRAEVHFSLEQKRSPNWCPETSTDNCDCFKTFFDARASIVIKPFIEDQILPCPLNRIKAALLFQCSEEHAVWCVVFSRPLFQMLYILSIYTTSTTWISTEGTLYYREHKTAQTERKFLLYTTASNPVFPDCCDRVCCRIWEPAKLARAFTP